MSLIIAGAKGSWNTQVGLNSSPGKLMEPGFTSRNSALDSGRLTPSSFSQNSPNPALRPPKVRFWINPETTLQPGREEEDEGKKKIVRTSLPSRKSILNAPYLRGDFVAKAAKTGGFQEEFGRIFFFFRSLRSFFRLGLFRRRAKYLCLPEGAGNLVGSYFYWKKQNKISIIKKKKRERKENKK